jgi:hypothetical protein
LPGSNGIASAASSLLSAAAVRDRAAKLLSLGERGALPHFIYRAERLPAAVQYVLDTIRSRYPEFDVPFHSRWRHFTAGGVDRWRLLARDIGKVDSVERARIRFDLAITSVLLDAGAGDAWRYREQGGAEYSRSEGLAVASFHLFRSGTFSGAARVPLRADAAGLAALSHERLADGLQVSASNPILSIEGRLRLLQSLARALRSEPALFGPEARFGNLVDHMIARGAGGAVTAPSILDLILRGLGSIWPGRYVLGGVPLGDTWRHASLRTGDETDGYAPLHKLSQWLAYSLIEPLEEAGVRVVEIDGLTGLAEYRNGGLMIDTGVIEPRDPGLKTRRLRVDDEVVVEWRALTVALLDRMAEALRQRLGLDAKALPLARVLEGGTWAAGRRIALERRGSGNPPLTIESDGTVF